MRFVYTAVYITPIVICGFLISMVNFAYANPQPKLPAIIEGRQLRPLSLSKKESIFLQKNPVIQIGTDHRWDPFAIKKSDGSLEGFEIDLMGIFSEMTGAEFQIVTDRWARVQEMAKNRKIDGLADSTVNEFREPFFNFTKSYIQLYPAFVVKSDSNLNIKSPNDFSGKIVSILKGNAFNLSLLKGYPQIKIMEAPSEKDAIKFVIEGKADACLIAAHTFNTHYKRFSNIIKIGYIETNHPLNLVYSIRKDWPELIGILNKSISSIPRETYDRLFYKWFNLDPIHQVAKLNEINTVIVDNYFPYSFVNDKGEPDGYSVELIKAVAKEMGMDIVIRTEVWENALIKLLKGQVNALPLMAYSKDRDIQYDFSPPHTIAYDAFFTRKGTPKIIKSEDLINKRIIVMKNDRAHEYLNKMPFIDDKQLIIENSPVEALRKLSTGNGDILLMPKLLGIVLLREHNIQNVDTSPNIIQDYSRLLSFAVKEGDVELLAKLENGLRIIKERGEYRRIYDKWFGVYESHDLTFVNVLKYFLWIILTFSLISGLLLFWSVALKRQVSQRTKKLEAEINVRKRTEKALSQEKDSLQKALEEIKALSGLLPICASCKKIRDDKGYWNQIESYIQQHSDAKFSHGMCPDCSDKLYGDQQWYIEMKEEKKK